MRPNLLLVATSKGLLEYSLDDLQHPTVHFEGYSINLVFADPPTDRWWVGIAHRHWGQKLHYSDDHGKSWQEAIMPDYSGYVMPDGKPAKMRGIWSMASGKKGEYWMGTEPGGLFFSGDFGKSFQLVQSLWNHPSRVDGVGWFGTGGDYPFIHSIIVDPLDYRHVYVGISCAGVFETKDGGHSWEPKNNGLTAAYLPNPQTEVGHDPHQLKMPRADNKVIWQQNHCGVYFTNNGGESWNDVSGKGGLPDYGFALAVDDDNPGRAWVIPVESDERRIAPGLKLQVFTTEDFGETWSEDNRGLPEASVFDIVLRHGFSRNGEWMAFGTNNGNLYIRDSDKSDWNLISTHLSRVNSVVFT